MGREAEQVLGLSPIAVFGLVLAEAGVELQNMYLLMPAGICIYMLGNSIAE